MSAAELKEEEGVMEEVEGGAFFYEHTSVFTPFIRVCGEGLQLSQALQHHKSL